MSMEGEALVKQDLCKKLPITSDLDIFLELVFIELISPILEILDQWPMILTSWLKITKI